jgi:ADP-ribosylglycohydrolase
MGVPYEFRSPLDLGDVVFGAKGTHNQPVGTWSDDGALMLALLDSLLSKGFDPTDQATRILAWYKKGAYAPGGLVFDVGNTTSRAVSQISSGVDAISAGPTEEDACGNGSLMRILPITLVGRGLSPSEAVRQARLSSRVTHGHLLPQMACALYTLTCQELIVNGSSPSEAAPRANATLFRLLKKDGDMAALAALERLSDYTGPLTGTGYVVDAFRSAYAAFQGANSYADTIERAIRYGHDTDTTAAIAGGMAGIYYGLNAIPEEWLSRMRGKDIAGPLIERLLDTI